MSMRLEAYDDATWEVKVHTDGVAEATITTAHSRLTVVEKAGIIYIVAQEGCSSR
jgi:hypothetical protein